MRERVPSPQFSGNRPPSTDFEAVRDGHRAILLSYGPIDLSVARSIAAGTALLVPIVGNIFYSDPYIDIATGAVNAGVARIHFQDVANAQSPFMTAQPTSLFKVPFTQLLIENYAQPGKSLLIVYGTDLDLQPGISSQVQATIINAVGADIAGWDGAAWQSLRADNEGAGVGSLRVSRFSDSVALADAAGWGVANNAAVAAQFNRAQLFNPAASGKTLLLDALHLAMGATSDGFWIGEYNVALTTDTATAVSKQNGGAALVAQVRKSAGGVSIGLTSRMVAYAGNNAVTPIKFDPPLAIGQGKGLGVECQTVNTPINASFQWRER